MRLAAGCHPLREIPIDELTCADCPVGGWWRPRAWATLGGTGRPVAGEWCGGLQLHSGMIGSEAGDPAAAHELLQDLLRVDPEALQKVGVLVGIDLVGKLLRCLTGLVLLPLLPEHVQNRALVDLHGCPPLTTVPMSSASPATSPHKLPEHAHARAGLQQWTWTLETKDEAVAVTLNE